MLKIFVTVSFLFFTVKGKYAQIEPPGEETSDILSNLPPTGEKLVKHVPLINQPIDIAMKPEQVAEEIPEELKKHLESLIEETKIDEKNLESEEKKDETIPKKEDKLKDIVIESDSFDDTFKPLSHDISDEKKRMDEMKNYIRKVKEGKVNPPGETVKHNEREMDKPVIDFDMDYDPETKKFFKIDDEPSPFVKTKKSKHDLIIEDLPVDPSAERKSFILSKYDDLNNKPSIHMSEQKIDDVISPPKEDEIDQHKKRIDFGGLIPPIHPQHKSHKDLQRSNKLGSPSSHKIKKHRGLNSIHEARNFIDDILLGKNTLENILSLDNIKGTEEESFEPSISIIYGAISPDEVPQMRKKMENYPKENWYISKHDFLDRLHPNDCGRLRAAAEFMNLYYRLFPYKWMPEHTQTKEVILQMYERCGIPVDTMLVLASIALLSLCIVICLVRTIYKVLTTRNASRRNQYEQITVVEETICKKKSDS